jgi:hypothetical protein
MPIRDRAECSTYGVVPPSVHHASWRPGYGGLWDRNSCDFARELLTRDGLSVPGNGCYVLAVLCISAWCRWDEDEQALNHGAAGTAARGNDSKTSGYLRKPSQTTELTHPRWAETTTRGAGGQIALVESGVFCRGFSRMASVPRLSEDWLAFKGSSQDHERVPGRKLGKRRRWESGPLKCSATPARDLSARVRRHRSRRRAGLPAVLFNTCRIVADARRRVLHDLLAEIPCGFVAEARGLRGMAGVVWAIVRRGDCPVVPRSADTRQFVLE